MKIQFLLPFVLFTLLFSSCKKENQSQVSFWFKESISNYLMNIEGSTSLSIYIDEQLKGNIPISEWKPGPDCGGLNFTTTVELGKEDSKNFNYIVRDQSGDDKFNGTFTAENESCLSIELVF